MARPLRLLVPGGYYHVTSRGNARQTIYREDSDREAFLSLLKDSIKRYGWRCGAFCLMANHFHLLLQTPEPNLSDGMRDLKSSYARRFHREHGTDGALFRPRFWAQLVADDGYLIAAARYIALNPIRAALVKKPEDFTWSSYADLASGQDRFGVLDASTLLARLEPDPSTARERYASIVVDGAGLPPFDPGIPIAGSPDFVKTHAPAKRPASPVVKEAWEQARPELRDLLDRLPRHEFVRYARKELHYPLRDIALVLGCSETTVRRRLAKVDGLG